MNKFKSALLCLKSRNLICLFQSLKDEKGIEFVNPTILINWSISAVHFGRESAQYSKGQIIKFSF